jgi:hypothetical protein
MHLGSWLAGAPLLISPLCGRRRDIACRELRICRNEVIRSRARWRFWRRRSPDPRVDHGSCWLDLELICPAFSQPVPA